MATYVVTESFIGNQLLRAEGASMDQILDVTEERVLELTPEDLEQVGGGLVGDHTGGLA